MMIYRPDCVMSSLLHNHRHPPIHSLTSSMDGGLFFFFFFFFFVRAPRVCWLCLLVRFPACRFLCSLVDDYESLATEMTCWPIWCRSVRRHSWLPVEFATSSALVVKHRRGSRRLLGGSSCCRGRRRPCCCWHAVNYQSCTLHFITTPCRWSN